MTYALGDTFIDLRSTVLSVFKQGLVRKLAQFFQRILWGQIHTVHLLRGEHLLPSGFKRAPCGRVSRAKESGILNIEFVKESSLDSNR